MPNIHLIFDAHRAARVLFLLNALIWLILGVLSLARILHAGPVSPLVAGVVVILVFGNAAAMLACAVGLGRWPRPFFWLALAVLLVNILLNVTDEFGLLDLLTLALDLLILGLLVAGERQRRESARAAPPPG